MTNKKINVAIDGTSSSGKSSMAKALAAYAGYTYIDTGAMYRSVALYCMRNHLVGNGEVDKAALIAALPSIKISFQINANGVQETFLNGENVERDIRSFEVSSNVSYVAAIPEVRRAMVAQQQEMGRNKGVVMDGRDICTTVLPDAEIKIYVHASAEIRAKRRFREMVAKGDTTVKFEDVLANVKLRDHIDSTREESPLRKADDAYDLDSTDFANADIQNAWMIGYFTCFLEHFQH